MQHNSVKDKRWELAMARQWFADLDQGTGAAEILAPEVREKLQWTTVEIAAEQTIVERHEQAKVNRARRAAAERHAREQAREETEARRVSEEAALVAARQRAREEIDRARVREEATRARELARKEASIARARTFAQFSLRAYLTMAVTVLVPWLIGLNWFRDSWFRPRSFLLYSSGSRNVGDYFWTDYLTGLAVLSIGIGIPVFIVSLVNARDSKLRIFLSAAMISSAFAMVIPAASSAWESAELTTARTESSWIPSTSSGCGNYSSGWGKASVVLSGAGGIDHTWTALPFQEYDGECTKVAIWDGVRPVETVETPNIIDGIIAAFAGSSPDESYAVFAAAGPVPECDSSWCQPDSEMVGGFGLTDTKVKWQRQLRLTYLGSPSNQEHPLAVATATSFYVVENPKTTNARLLALDPATGDILWAVTCPPDAPVMADLDGAQTYDERVLLQCDTTEPGYRLFAVADDGTLTNWESE